MSIEEIKMVLIVFSWALIFVALLVVFLYFSIKKKRVSLEEELILSYKRREDEVEQRFADMKLIVNKLQYTLFVDNFFKNCPCCKGEDKILRSEAVCFQKVATDFSFLFGYESGVEELYCTKEAYEIHKTKIKQWEKEVEEYQKLKK